MLNQLRPAFASFAALTVVTGVLYPAIVTGVSNIVFPSQSTGSLIERDGKVIGSALIAQPFTADKYFWPRPSAVDYNGASSGGSNYGPNNPDLAADVATRLQTLGATENTRVSADLVTASGSGLDPHITPSSAEYQVARVATARGMSEADVRQTVLSCTEPRTLGVLGEPRVNVLRLNTLLDHPDLSRSAPEGQHSIVGWRGRAFLPESH